MRTIKPCQTCKDWNDCPGKEYFQMSDIRYCPHQILFIIENFIDYRSGNLVITSDKWPPENKVTGYVDTANIQKSVPSHAPFERPMQIAAEVRARLCKTGADGKFLVVEVHAGEYTFSKEAKNALYYCSGWRRKGSYYRWKSNQQYYKSKTKIS